MNTKVTPTLKATSKTWILPEPEPEPEITSDPEPEPYVETYADKKENEYGIWDTQIEFITENGLDSVAGQGCRN